MAHPYHNKACDDARLAELRRRHPLPGSLVLRFNPLSEEIPRNDDGSDRWEEQDIEFLLRLILQVES
jgi:hypothetical protein